MKQIYTLLLLPAAALLCLAQENIAHKNELAFGLGGFPSFSRSDAPKVDLGPSVALQVNYARRIVDRRRFALYGEINFLASPRREVSSSVTTATRDIASVYVTPGLKFKLLPTSRISPYFAIGGGYADYEQSTTQLGGGRNPASRQLSRGVFDFGTGIDVRVWRWAALRGEARDFYSGSPNYNAATISGGQHNVVASVAFVLR
jgi:hypothetical protein